MLQFLKKFHAIKIFLKILGFFSRKSLFLLNKCWQVANRPQNCQPATPATAKFCRPHKPQNRPRWPNSATSGHTDGHGGLVSSRPEECCADRLLPFPNIESRYGLFWLDLLMIKANLYYFGDISAYGYQVPLRGSKREL